MPMSNDGVYKACCGKILCACCVTLSRDHKKCPFCRADENVSSEEHIQRIKDRMDKNDPEAFHMLAAYYDRGAMGLSLDSEKAHELWEQSLAIEPTGNAHYNLSKSYRAYYEQRGVEKDLRRKPSSTWNPLLSWGTPLQGVSWEGTSKLWVIGSMQRSIGCYPQRKVVKIVWGLGSNKAF